MGAYYHARIAGEEDGVVTLEVGFGTPASNDVIVPDAVAAIAGLGLKGGRGIKIDGPASLPVAMAIGHAVAHLFGWVACKDPKLGRFVVAISHDPARRPGDLMD
jgi:CRISPR-associated protein Csx3